MWWPHGTAWTEAHAAVGFHRDRHRVGRRRRRGRSVAGGHGDVPARRQHRGCRRHRARDAAVRNRATASQDFTVAANARFTVPVVTSEAPASAGYMRVPRGTRFSAVVESLGATPIVVERAMYWNASGQLVGRGLGPPGDQTAVAHQGPLMTCTRFVVPAFAGLFMVVALAPAAAYAQGRRPSPTGIRSRARRPAGPRCISRAATSAPSTRPLTSAASPRRAWWFCRRRT